MDYSPLLKADKKGQNLQNQRGRAHQNWFPCISHEPLLAWIFWAYSSFLIKSKMNYYNHFYFWCFSLKQHWITCNIVYSRPGTLSVLYHLCSHTHTHTTAIFLSIIFDIVLWPGKAVMTLNSIHETKKSIFFMFKIIILLIILFLSSLGGSVKLMDSSELSRRYPWLHTDDLSLGSLGNAILKE